MLKIAFVNMPFAALQRPSIALTQLESVIDREYQGRVSTAIHYLNQDFGREYGIDRYQHVVQSIDALNGGFGDWFFRSVAFPDVPDNSESYFHRYYVEETREHQLMRAFVAAERPRLAPYLDSLIDRYALDQADIVGFTSMFTQNVASFAMARRLKRRRPEILIAMGGANCEAPMGREIVNHVDAVDFVFSGPALRSFPAFLERMLAGDAGACHRLDGVFSRRNRVKASGSAPLLLGGRGVTLPEIGPVGAELPIDAEIPLDYDGFMSDVERNFPSGEIEPALTFETSRGCWWGERAHCTFCGLNSESMGYRSMRSERALALIRSLFKYSPRVRRLECVDNIMPKEYLEDVFPRLETPPGMTIFYEVKADLAAGDLAVLSRAGVKSLQPGIEALATSTLKLMKKGTSAFGNIRFLEDCVRHDVYPEWNLLVAFPGEDEPVYAAYERDIPLLRHLPPPSGVYPVRFDRFSPYFTKAAEYGLDLHPYDFYEMVYPFPPASLRNVAYYFIDRNFSADYITKGARWLGRLRAQVDAWRELWQTPVTGPPRLFLESRGGATYVHDSRSGRVLMYSLTPPQLRVLSALDRPAGLDHVAAACGLSAADAAHEIDWLRSHGLIFGEGERLVGLAFGTEPPVMERYKRPEKKDDAPALVARPRGERRAKRSDLATSSVP